VIDEQAETICTLNARSLALFLYLILCSYDYNVHVEGLPSANLHIVTLISSEQCSQFERFRLQHVQIVNKTSSSKQNRRAELTAIPLMFNFTMFKAADLPLQITASGQRRCRPRFKIHDLKIELVNILHRVD